MMQNNLLIAAVAVTTFCSIAAANNASQESSRGRNKKVAISELPEEIVSAAEKAMSETEWKDAEMNYDLGPHESLVIYEIAGSKDGREVEVDVRADGTIEELEHMIELTDVPKAVMELLSAELPGFKAQKAEKSVRPYRNGKEAVWYELKGITKAGAILDAEITEDGNYYVLEAN